MAQTITESTRFALQQRAREVLGEQEGDTLMAHLPPVGWADVATKNDLEHLATKADLERGLRRQTMWMVSILGAQTAIFAGLVVWLVERLAS